MINKKSDQSKEIKPGLSGTDFTQSLVKLAFIFPVPLAGLLHPVLLILALLYSFTFFYSQSFFKRIKNSAPETYFLLHIFLWITSAITVLFYALIHYLKLVDFGLTCVSYAISLYGIKFYLEKRIYNLRDS